MREPAAIIGDIRALADELEEALGAPAAQHSRASRGVRRAKPKLVPNDLQRAQARRVLAERGLR